MRKIIQWFRGLFRGGNLGRLVAERLRGEDLRKIFVNRVVRSMKENPQEWSVESWEAKHKSGIVVDAKGYINKFGNPGEALDGFFASITYPSFTLLTQEESEVLGDAFDYLLKLKILQSLGMDRE